MRFSFYFYFYEFLEKRDLFLFFLLKNTSRSYIDFMFNTVRFFRHAQNFSRIDSLDKWDYLMSNIDFVHDFIIKKNLDLILYPIRGYGEFYLDEHKIFNKVQPFRHSLELELMWSSYPLFTVISILVPSLYFLYSTEDKGAFFDFTLNVSGYQWGWEYNFNNVVDVVESIDNSNYFINFVNQDLIIDNLNLENVIPRIYPYELNVGVSDVFLDLDSLSYAYKRLLEVQRLCLPTNNVYRIQITSDDVLHSWAMPSFGLKSDAVPGRINIVLAIPSKPGVYFGQCSELCGVGHGFMPIAIRIDDFASFFKWIWTQNNVQINPLTLLNSSDEVCLTLLNEASNDVRGGLLNVLFYFSSLLYPNTNSDVFFNHNIWTHIKPCNIVPYIDYKDFLIDSHIAK